MVQLFKNLYCSKYLKVLIGVAGDEMKEFKQNRFFKKKYHQSLSINVSIQSTILNYKLTFFIWQNVLLCVKKGFKKFAI